MTESAGPSEQAGPPDHLARLRGMDMVRRTLEEARGAARSQGKDVGRGRTSPQRRVAGRGKRRTWSGPGPDVRDPQTFGSATMDLARTRGWTPRVAEGSIFGQWPTVVGEQIAEHANPSSLREGCTDRDGGVDGMGHPAADGAGPDPGEDRGGRRRRRGHVAEDRRPERPDVAQGQVSHRRPRPP